MATKIVRYPLYKIDRITKIKKRTFIMNCENCSIFLSGEHKECKEKGCKFQRQYNTINPEFTEDTKLRIIKIYMESYYKFR